MGHFGSRWFGRGRRCSQFASSFAGGIDEVDESPAGAIILETPAVHSDFCVLAHGLGLMGCIPTPTTGSLILGSSDGGPHLSTGLLCGVHKLGREQDDISACGVSEICLQLDGDQLTRRKGE